MVSKMYKEMYSRWLAANLDDPDLKPEENAASLVEEIQTLEEYKGDVVNILVCGIDYEDGRGYSSDGTNDGIRHRRKDRRSGDDVHERYFDDSGQPGRTSGDVPACRIFRWLADRDAACCAALQRRYAV